MNDLFGKISIIAGKKATIPSKLFLIILLYMLIAGFHFISCTARQNSQVPEEFIKNLSIARYIMDYKYLEYYKQNGFDTNGAEQPNFNLLSESDIQIIENLMDNNYKTNIKYYFSHATCVVDISNTGLIEWFNINVLLAPPRAMFDNKKYIVLYLKEIHGEWYLLDYSGVNLPAPLGWPDVPSEFRTVEN